MAHKAISIKKGSFPVICWKEFFYCDIEESKVSRFIARYYASKKIAPIYFFLIPIG